MLGICRVGPYAGPVGPMRQIGRSRKLRVASPILWTARMRGYAVSVPLDSERDSFIH